MVALKLRKDLEIYSIILIWRNSTQFATKKSMGINGPEGQVASSSLKPTVNILRWAK